MHMYIIHVLCVHCCTLRSLILSATDWCDDVLSLAISTTLPTLLKKEFLHSSSCWESRTIILIPSTLRKWQEDHEKEGGRRREGEGGERGKGRGREEGGERGEEEESRREVMSRVPYKERGYLLLVRKHNKQTPKYMYTYSTM